jgi:cytochrome c
MSLVPFSLAPFSLALIAMLALVPQVSQGPVLPTAPVLPKAPVPPSAPEPDKPTTHPVGNATAISQEAMMASGKALVEANCQVCHAIGKTGASPNPKSPPFRMLSRRYPIDTIAEAFAEGVFVGHPEMPEFELEPSQIDSLIAYLKSVQQPLPTKRKKATVRSRVKTRN